MSFSFNCNTNLQQCQRHIEYYFHALQRTSQQIISTTFSFSLIQLIWLAQIPQKTFTAFHKH